MFIKTLVLYLLFSFYGYSQDVLPRFKTEKLLNLDHYKLQSKMYPKSKYWTLNTEAKYYEKGKSYLLPRVNFYSNKQLSGEPVASLNKDGLFYKSKKICNVIEFRDKLEVLVRLDDADKRAGDSYCDHLSQMYESSGGIDSSFLFAYGFTNIDKNIGETIIMGKKVYVDIRPFKAYDIVPPTKKILSDLLDKESLKKLEDVFSFLKISVCSKEKVSMKDFPHKGFIASSVKSAQKRFKKLLADKLLLSEKDRSTICSALNLEYMITTPAVMYSERSKNSVGLYVLDCKDRIEICDPGYRIGLHLKKGKWVITSFRGLTHSMARYQ